MSVVVSAGEQDQRPARAAQSTTSSLTLSFDRYELDRVRWFDPGAMEDSSVARSKSSGSGDPWVIVPLNAVLPSVNVPSYVARI